MCRHCNVTVAHLFRNFQRVQGMPTNSNIFKTHGDFGFRQRHRASGIFTTTFTEYTQVHTGAMYLLVKIWHHGRASFQR